MNEDSTFQYSNGITFSKQLDSSCLKRLYQSGGNLSADARRAGLPKNAIPLELLTSNRDKYIDRVLEELIGHDNLPSLFILALLEWSTDRELLSVIKQIAMEIETPGYAAPRVWTGLQTSDRQKLEELWSEFRPLVTTSPADTANLTAPELDPDKEKMMQLEFTKELAQCIQEEYLAQNLLIRISFPSEIAPKFDRCETSLEFWQKVCCLIDKGFLGCNGHAGFKKIVKAATELCSGNPIFQKIYQEYFE